ncbi:enhancer of mRNA-decapping protein 3 isoform X1 [Bradysia coprophila]|uniref:enhancer of mRNA-decapping protein 3 isoform X1 n=1 Tax=Bradysia coprophila TaxID=38358 RepID=UPI00187DBC86|nr:enhancer of mRNA-decapping protein 3 isoform X1 [Bradysia coprophila]
MNKSWQGKAVSIYCGNSLGVFQGIIKDANNTKLTIVNTFVNGLPLRTMDTEVTIKAEDIIRLEFIPPPNSEVNGANKVEQQSNGESSLNHRMKDIKISKTSKSPTKMKPISPPKFNHAFGNMIPAKVEVKLSGTYFEEQRNATSFKSEKRKCNQLRRIAHNSNTFDTPIDHGVLQSDFDFEKNLALFDKQAIWDEIDAIQKPDLLPQSCSNKSKNYRHDENILSSKPTGLRQISTGYQCIQEFATDDDLVIPSIPVTMRYVIQRNAEAMGLTKERQTDMLARGATELAILLLGGARRLVPMNQHQWPTILIICDEPYNEELSEVGLATGRILASHGLKILVSVGLEKKSTRKSNELQLLKGCKNVKLITTPFSEVPPCDLVILAIKSKIPSPQITKWINVNRSPITLAIDPPATGIQNITIKYSILPILPIDGVAACGKLYLCNLGIPGSCFSDAGIKYESPFGHKFVIPLHTLCGDE